jgi:hypothetical protein
MGFSIKLEQYWCGKAASLKAALRQRPFLFIGYYFHVTDEGVPVVCCDLPRTMAQVPYPALKWAKTDGELELTEAMRLGSIAMNLGISPKEYAGAFQAFREGAAALLRKAIGRHGDVSDPKLRWACGENPWGAQLEPALSGVLVALERDPGVLWLSPEVRMVREFGLLSWADEAEAEEEEEAQASGLTAQRPVGAVLPRPQRLPPGSSPTHPVTERNHGRPPPTAVWGPPKEPRQSAPGPSGGGRTGRRRGRSHRLVIEDNSPSDEAEEPWWEWE